MSMARLQHILDQVNRAIIFAGALALVLAACAMSYSVAVRSFLKSATDWQDEFSVFLLIGATFLSAAYVQSARGHVAIEALREILPPGVDRLRRVAADGLTAAYCLFFSWKCWMMLRDAWVDGQVSNSTWGPPMWVPYSSMAVGMTLLGLQLVLQFVASVRAAANGADQWTP